MVPPTHGWLDVMSSSNGSGSSSIVTSDKYTDLSSLMDRGRIAILLIELLGFGRWKSVRIRSCTTNQTKYTTEQELRSTKQALVTGFHKTRDVDLIRRDTYPYFAGQIKFRRLLESLGHLATLYYELLTDWAHS